MAWPSQLPPPDPVLVKSLTEQQEVLRQQVRLQKPDFHLKLLAGCDSSFIGENILSVFVVLTYPALELVESVWHYDQVELPYIPGFLAFREAPNLVKAYAKLEHEPDLIMVDGHGIAHPRRLGIASQLGVLLNKSTMGVAKKVLAGRHEEPAMEKGSITPLTHRGEHIGNVIRTKDKVKPVFVSPGHLMDMETATAIALQTALKHKLPEPTRLADHYAEVFKKEVR
ncbi:deoxyribonuclease V [Rufibacter glacialis]|uniref:Endonuclease V n=1 Tax=Rufibacter glacialis TaxID=1259555 RepID=A0A5M8Q5D4_9BACT|nr:deoxyribonuclease V [Rufibacter glacialis]KAA6430298.1 endonuclease V [Rufibacter glacialis]GGK88048.1 endonuclease V [Rufibacter glacialis]